MADKDFKIWKGETKVFMAIERTMIGWLRYAGTIGVGAFAVNVLGHGSFKGATGALGAAQALAAILIAVGAYVRYRQRIKLVQQRYHGAFGDVAMPAIAGFVTLVLLGGVVCVGFERWYGYTFRAAECAPLPYPVFDGAKPPFLYLSFHGSNQPVNAYCHAALGVSGVHRFALSENGSVKYAGPAVDQHSALLKMPRGMAQARKLLFILDGSAQDSSVAVFGECPTESGLAVRPFLGRIRPEGAKLAAAFSHPYGMSTTSSGALRISAQNGGAVVGIDLATGDMSVVQKVAQPYSSHMRTLDEKSGPLRDIVIDESGCSHVADRVDGLVRHYCPADGDLVASSKARSSSSMHLDARRPKL